MKLYSDDAKKVFLSFYEKHVKDYDKCLIHVPLEMQHIARSSLTDESILETNLQKTQLFIEISVPYKWKMFFEKNEKTIIEISYFGEK